MAELRAVLFDIGGTLFTYDALEPATRAVAVDFAELLGIEDQGVQRWLPRFIVDH